MIFWATEMQAEFASAYAIHHLIDLLCQLLVSLLDLGHVISFPRHCMWFIFFRLKFWEQQLISSKCIQYKDSIISLAINWWSETSAPPPPPPPIKPTWILELLILFLQIYTFLRHAVLASDESLLGLINYIIREHFLFPSNNLLSANPQTRPFST